MPPRFSPLERSVNYFTYNKLDFPFVHHTLNMIHCDFEIQQPERICIGERDSREFLRGSIERMRLPSLVIFFLLRFNLLQSQHFGLAGQASTNDALGRRSWRRVRNEPITYNMVVVCLFWTASFVQLFFFLRLFNT